MNGRTPAKAFADRLSETTNRKEDNKPAKKPPDTARALVSPSSRRRLGSQVKCDPSEIRRLDTQEENLWIPRDNVCVVFSRPLALVEPDFLG